MQHNKRYRSWLAGIGASLAAGALAVCAGCGGGGSAASGAAPLEAFSSALTNVEQADTTHAYFTAPAFGAMATGQTVTFTWTAVSNATGYELQVGTTRGGNDLYESGALTGLSATVGNLPATGIVYARVRGLLASDAIPAPTGYWPRGSDLVIRVDGAMTGAGFVYPAQGTTAVAGTQAIVWTLDPVALSYRLKVGTTSGGSDVDDSGEVNVDRRLVPYPPAGRTLYATLTTTYSAGTTTQTATLNSDGATPGYADRLKVARALTGVVRQMAGLDNQPLSGTLLEKTAYASGAGNAACVLFTQTLIDALAQANAGLNSRALNICLNPNNADCHTLVEVLNTDTQRWETLDPTFGLVTLRASDGVPAISSEISAAARSLNWPALAFDFLTPLGDAYATGYYLDYPLLYVNVQTPDGSSYVQSVLTDLSPYFDNAGPSVTNAWNAYALACAAGSGSVNALIDGTSDSYPCTGGTGQSEVFLASTVTPVAGDGSLAAVERARRFVFANPAFVAAGSGRRPAVMVR